MNVPPMDAVPPMNTVPPTNTILSMNIVCTGMVPPAGKRIHKVLRPGYTLHVGATCNDGRPITQSARYKEAIAKGISIVSEHTVRRKRPTVYQKVETKELWVDTYAPRTVSDIIGHKESIQQLTAWLSSWEQQEHRGILITGPPGIGKTTTVHLVAQSLGYKVAEHNASDTRSVSLLKGMIALGMKRLQKEVIVMDEVDGLSGSGERGGVGELADLIRKTRVPIICIANQTPPKLKPIQSACITIKFHRPVKSTIATALLTITKKEGLSLTKTELEGMCERSGNDIRAILNHLQFDHGSAGEKDASLRLDLFSATQKLLGNKRISLTEAEDLVFVDYGMVPLMVQEGYLAASRGSLEETAAAAEQISFGDLMNRRLWNTQDWTLLPHVVHSTAATARMVTGPCPFQIFPQVLGKNSRRGKHRRLMEEVSSLRRRPFQSFRLDEAEMIQRILLHGLTKDKPDIKGTIHRLDTLHISRDQLMENISENLFHPIEIPTKVKTALTREYNKSHQAKRKRVSTTLEEEELEELDQEMEDLDLINETL